MPGLSHREMDSIRAKKIDKEKKLLALMSTPFNLQNTEQLNALKEYIDDFELYANQMHLFQAASHGIKSWTLSWIIGRFLPVPEFVVSLFTISLYLGVVGCILKGYSVTDFYDNLLDMKRLYMWALKKGDADTDPEKRTMVLYDNVDTKLANVHIRRMIKIMAPLCTKEFMIAWDTSDTANDSNKGWAILSLFSAQNKTNSDQNCIDELKTHVEEGRFELSVFQGAQQAIQYFATDRRYHDLLKSKVKRQIQELNLTAWIASNSSIGGFKMS